MAIADLKIESWSKALCLGVLSVYLLSQVSIALRTTPGADNADALAKALLIRPSCLLVLGGSNARNGFRAAALSTPGCPALNLAVSAELGNFERYMAWLGDRAQAETVIYSTMLVLSPTLPSDDPVLGAIDHVTPLAGRLKVLLLGQPEDPSSAFTPMGDQIRYACDQAFRGQYLELAGLERGTPEVVAELSRRVAAIKRVTGARRVVLHTPRVYVDDPLRRNRRSRLLEALGGRLTAIRQAGIEVLDAPVVHSDRSMFCDDRHANAKGREEITAETRGALASMGK